MAWIIGLVTDEELEKLREIGWEAEELEKLRKIGWEAEDIPSSLLSSDNGDDGATSGTCANCTGRSCTFGGDPFDGMATRAFFVDSDVFDIMTGPDWAKASCTVAEYPIEDAAGRQAHEKIGE